jgi:hypothetical protein
MRALEDENRNLRRRVTELEAESENRDIRQRLAELEASVRKLLPTVAQHRAGRGAPEASCDKARPTSMLVPVPLDEDRHNDAVESKEEIEPGRMVSTAGSAPPPQRKRRRRHTAGTNTIDNTNMYCGATPAKRLQYRFSTAGGARQWFGGTVTKLVTGWPGWVSVDFDDGEDLDVLLEPGGEGAAWRWEPESASTSWAPVVALGCDDKQLMLSNKVDATAPAAASTLTRTPRSRFIGVTWDRRRGEWIVTLRHLKKRYRRLGRFPKDKEEDAARAFDAAARRIRGTQAHGGWNGNKLYRLNFPTKEEVAAAAVSMANGGKSFFDGLSFDKGKCKWHVGLDHRGEKLHLGYFPKDQEQEAARAYDAAARRCRGALAHGGLCGARTYRLNFPTKAEAARFRALQ